MLSIELTAGMGERLRVFLQSRNVGADHLLFTRVYDPLREVLDLEDVPTCAELHFDHCGGTPAQEEVIQDLEDQLSLMDSLVESQAAEITRLQEENEELRQHLTDKSNKLADAVLEKIVLEDRYQRSRADVQFWRECWAAVAENLYAARKEIDTLRRANGYLLDEIEDLSDAEQSLRREVEALEGIEDESTRIIMDLRERVEDISDAEKELREGIRSVITNPVVIRALREEQSVPSAVLRYLLDVAGMGQYGEGEEAFRDYEITV